MDATHHRENIFFRPGSDAEGAVIFLPTDTAGTPGLLNTEVIENLGLAPSIIPRDVSNYSLVKLNRGNLCFVVTVGNGDTATLLASNLTDALLDKRVLRAKSLWIPLMGTGAGQLSLRESYEIIENALRATGWLNKTDASIIIAPPAKTRIEDVAGASPASSIEGIEEQVEHPEVRLASAVQAALEFAAGLRAGTDQRRGPVSTTLLFFALSESQTEAAPNTLRKDHASLLFSGAIHALAGSEQYREVWEAYFSSAFTLPASPLTNRSFRLTPNVQEVLRRAEQRSGTRPAEIDDVVRSLLAYPKGRHRTTIEAMDVSMDKLLGEYNDALTGAIGKKLVNDVAAETDQLGYDRYANAITDFLVDAETPPPLSISIQAPWGAGKSSLMHQIRNKLDPKEQREKFKTAQNALSGGNRLKLGEVLSFLDRRHASETSKPVGQSELWTVWFNAWKYDTSEQMWAGLVDAIVSQISNRLHPVDRELFLLRLQLARIDDGIVRRKIYDRIVTIWWAKVRAWLIAGGAAIASFVGVGSVVTATQSLNPTLTALLEWSPLVPIVALATYLSIEYFKSREKTQNEPASFSLAEYLTVPNSIKLLGSVHHIHQDLVRVLSLTPIQATTDLPTPIVVFIDDLDRCSPSKVASVVEGVSMFLASDDYRCMFVIGMDPQMIAAALEEAHAKVRIQLPRYERTVPLGWRFMDKFIQLPFTIPPSGGSDLEKYVNWLGEVEAPATPAASTSKGRTSEPEKPHIFTSHPSPSKQPLPTEEREEASGDFSERASEAERKFKESRDVGIIIRHAALDTAGNPGNPREIKRIANLARLYLGLRNSRRANDPPWRSPSLDQYARWITVTLRWPDMMRWLQWGADEGTWTTAQSSIPLIERRLQLLQDQAQIARKADGWAKALEKTLKVPINKESDWACDHKLFEFFQAEARLEPHQTLSDAARQGFW